MTNPTPHLERGQVISRLVLLAALGVAAIVFFNEFVMYRIVIGRCSWPKIPSGSEDATRRLRVLIFTDSHIFSPDSGHIFHNLRYEWQMWRSFQTALQLHQPDAVFFLGDTSEWGAGLEDKVFEDQVKKFYTLFDTPVTIPMHVIAGNHDTFFHEGMITRTGYERRRRFEKAFDSYPIQLVEISGNLFVTLNSMALHGDGCQLCSSVENKIQIVRGILDCLKKNSTDCFQQEHLESGLVISYSGLNSTKSLQYTRPILMHHFPLYRTSDRQCHVPANAPDDIINIPFRERFDTVSEEMTFNLIHSLLPRASFSGHTHHACYVEHQQGHKEWTLTSFNWFYKKNPGFVMAEFSPQDFAVKTCFVPEEPTWYAIYLVGVPVLVLVLAVVKIYTYRSRYRQYTLLKSLGTW